MCDRAETPRDGESPKYTDQDERSDKPDCDNSAQLLTAELRPPLVPRGMTLRSANDINKHRLRTADATTSDAEPSLYLLRNMNEDSERVHRNRNRRQILRKCLEEIIARPRYCIQSSYFSTTTPVELRLLEHMESERERAQVVRSLRRRVRAPPLAQHPPLTPPLRHSQLPHIMVTTPFQMLVHMDGELERVHAVGGLRPSMTTPPEPLPLDLTTRLPPPQPHRPHSEADSSQ